MFDSLIYARIDTENNIGIAKKICSAGGDSLKFEMKWGLLAGVDEINNG